MDDEVAHPRVVHRRLGLALPGIVGGRVIREHADDINRLEIGEADTLDILKFPAKYQMKELRFEVFRRVVRRRHLAVPVLRPGVAREWS